MDDDDYIKEVRRRIRACLDFGSDDLTSVLQRCEGADPVTVARLLEEEVSRPPVGSRQPGQAAVLSAFDLPASDPERSQWWFSTAGLRVVVDLLLQRDQLLGEDKRILCLGCPSVAAVLSVQQERVVARDVDEDVVQMLRRRLPGADVQVYDAAYELPGELVESCGIAVIDPPWYEAAIATFLNRALSSLTVGGEAICTLPGRLTRPGIEASRAQLVAAITSAGHEILGIERGAVGYQVPSFEAAALGRLPDFRGIPWRSGDLLHFRKKAGNLLPSVEFRSVPSERFSRNAAQFRVFLRGTASADERIPAQVLQNYSQNISTRAYAGEEPDVWTSTKVGVLIGNLAMVRLLVSCWAEGDDREQAVARLVQSGEKEPFGQLLAATLDEHLALWQKHASAPPLRSEVEIEKARSSSFSEFATPPARREHAEPGDGFRSTYSRDRDRLLWSAGLRRLSDKTQLFPTGYDDDLRRRLTHSVEVMQLATTIGASFGLDRDLIEAGALAHDIGHTPFGHAGEHALDRLLDEIDPKLGGFNHYEHGVDVVRYLEGPYYVSPVSGFAGLNLTPEVCETIVKHTYCHGDLKGAEEILRRSKHRGFVAPGYCHLEGQAVRAADKISYLISDLEDGIRLGALQHADLLRCRFFHRPPLDFSYSPNDGLSEAFLIQRRSILKLLMEDLLLASSRRLAQLGSQRPDAVRSAGQYMVQHSDEMLEDIAEIWRTLQSGRLHKDRRVVAANLHAARIVSTLVLACTVVPELIDDRFRTEHERLHRTPYLKHYRSVASSVTIRAGLLSQLPTPFLIGSEHKPGRDFETTTERLIAAKDYVAALTDARARSIFQQATGERAVLAI